jgi:hypothetical protein
VAKLPAPVAKEMATAVVELNKVLGLESWPAQGFESCLDRGGLEATAKDVSAEDTKKCADTALDAGFPELGRSYVIGIPMAGIGPVTVFAIGLAQAEGWGAYSCDTTRKCPPTKLNGPSKQAATAAPAPTARPSGFLLARAFAGQVQAPRRKPRRQAVARTCRETLAPSGGPILAAPSLYLRGIIAP